MLVFAVALGLVAAAAVFKAVVDRRAAHNVVAPELQPTDPVASAATSPAVSLNSSNTAAVLEELRGAERMRELDEVRELQASGGATPNTAELLLSKLTHKEADVREAALVALVHLGDTNVIPGLEQALAITEDPRDKVALMDAIEYLKLPTESEDLSPSVSPDAAGKVDRTIRRKAPSTTPSSGRAKRPARDLSQRVRGSHGAPATPPAAPAPTAPPPQ